MDQTTLAITSIVIGWFLGLLAPPIQERLKRGYLKKRIREAIHADLKDLRETLAFVVVLIEARTGTLTKEHLQWFRSAYDMRRTLPESLSQLAPIMDRLEAIDEPTFQRLSSNLTQKERHGLSFKQYNLPYLQSKVADLDLFPESVQRHLLDILAHLQILNDHVDESRFYYRLTFDSSISQQNHQTALDERLRCCRLVATQARIIVELCGIVINQR